MIGSWRKGRDYPNDSITKNGQNPETCLGDLRRFAVSQTPVKNDQLTLMWKTLKEKIIITTIIIIIGIPSKSTKKRSKPGWEIRLETQIKKSSKTGQNDTWVPDWMTKGKTTLIQKDPSKGPAPNNYRPITCLPMMWKILPAKINEEISYSLTTSKLFLEEQKVCWKGSRGTKSTHPKWEQDQTEKSSYGQDWPQKRDMIWFHKAG